MMLSSYLAESFDHSEPINIGGFQLYKFTAQILSGLLKLQICDDDSSTLIDKV